MFRFDAEKSVHFCDGLRRRDFLHAVSCETSPTRNFIHLHPTIKHLVFGLMRERVDMRAGMFH